jgi:cellulose synthase operon protein C
MRRALIWGCAAVSFAALSSTASAVDDALVRGLVRNAWYWQARAREDKAAEVWKAVLAAAPEQADALAALGGLDARAGRLQQAREALARVEKIAPRHPDLAVLRREIELGSRFGALVTAARKLVHEGRVDDGIARYRQVFGGAGPPGDLALEYFETLGGTPAGWDEARDGLRRLVSRVPDEPRFRLALARLLTYRDGTRREGIKMLADVARDPTVSKQATAAWRDAVLWLGASPEDEPFLREYLRSHPRDAAVAAALEKARRSALVGEGFAALHEDDAAAASRHFAAAGDAPGARRGLALARQREAALKRKAGFTALDRGDLAGAERIFNETGGDPDARLGLALVAIRRAAEAQRDHDYARARSLLQRASALAPLRSDLWQPALDSVEFWSRVDDARRSRERGQDDLAERELREALERAPPGERWNAELALADLRAARGERDAADELYRRVLDRVPRQPDALRGRASLLVQAGRYDEAIEVNEALREAAPDKAFKPGWLRAEARRSRAARARAARDLAGARAELEAARREDSTDVWVLHDLANVLLESGAPDAASPVVAALLQAAPQLPEARIAQARLLAARGDGARALEVLSTVPPASLDPDLVTLRHRLEVAVRVPALVERARGSARAAAVRELLALEREVEAEPQLAGAVALAWAQIGELGRAVALMRRATTGSPRETRTLRLQLASTLLQAGDDPGASALLAGLAREPGLSADEKRWLADLRVSQAVRVADRARAAGDARAADAALGPVLLDYPADPRVLGALGRVLERDDPRRAHAMYVRALARDPGDPEARRGAVDTSLALGDERDARELAAEGARRAPRDARMHLLVARAAARSGDDPGAMRALRRAEALVEAPPSDPSPATRPVAGAGRALDPPAQGSLHLAAMPAGSDIDPETRAEIAREVERVQDRHRSGVQGLGEIRERAGEGGLSALTELRQGAAAAVAIGYRGRATVRASRVELDAGTLSGTASSRFGSGARTSDPLRALGTALSAGYEGRALAAEVGSSPLGFPVQSLVGSVELRHAFGPVRVGLEGARRSVTESLLSYAGVRDPGTGRTWGGVVSEGGRLELGLELAPVRAYASGAYDWLVGDEVAQNRRAVASVGFDATVARGPLGAWTLGLAALGMRYDQNLRYFTLGHGGYFSPQRFVRGSIPVGWRKEGKVRWELVAAPGFESFEEADAPAFPALPGGGVPGLDEGRPPYPGQRVTGFALDARALLAWAPARSFELRATTALQQAPEYREWRAGIALTYGSAPW